MSGEAAVTLFRPRLDHPAAPPDPAAPVLRDAWAATVRDATRRAADDLRRDYGPVARLWDLSGFLGRFRPGPAPEAAEQMIATLGALAHFRSRQSPPRFRPGGTTDPANRRRRDRLRPYLVRLASGVLTLNLPASLSLRARHARLPADWAGARAVERRITALLPVGSSVAIRPRLERPGGAAALAMASDAALPSIEAALRRGEPCLVELIRDSSALPGAGEFAIVFALDRSGPGGMRLAICRADRPAQTVLLERGGTPDRPVFRERPADARLPVIRGIVHWRLPDVMPPAFGLRRWTRRLLPWRALWLIGRALRLRPSDMITGL